MRIDLFFLYVSRGWTHNQAFCVCSLKIELKLKKTGSIFIAEETCNVQPRLLRTGTRKKLGRKCWCWQGTSWNLVDVCFNMAIASTMIVPVRADFVQKKREFSTWSVCCKQWEAYRIPHRNWLQKTAFKKSNWVLPNKQSTGISATRDVNRPIKCANKNAM